MKIIYKQGDFLEGGEMYRAHGCNAKGVMGSGAALAVKNKYPEAFSAYAYQYEFVGLTLGQCIGARCSDDSVMFNLITQWSYGRDKNITYADYSAITRAMQAMDERMEHLTTNENSGLITPLAMPKIGSGLANGDWNIIEMIIENNSNYFQPIVYALKGD